jgi:hypothetical protein
MFLAACGARSGLQSTSGEEAAGGGGHHVGGGGSTSDGGSPPGGGGSGGLGGMGGDGGQGGNPPECEPGALLVYLVSSSNNLYSYKPSTGQLVLKGALDCDPSQNSNPFSMSVDRFGTAYVLYNDGNLYRVKVGDASCEGTDFEPGQLDFVTFGMGFARDLATKTDQLFVSDISFSDQPGGPQPPSKGLGMIDTETMLLSLVGTYDTNITDRMEMTSSNDGNLYGYSLDPNGGGRVIQLDKTSADVLDQTFLPIGNGNSALAFAFWGDDFYVFTSDGSVTDVNRYRPLDGSVAFVQQLGDVIVGAGVSTCDPM